MLAIPWYLIQTSGGKLLNAVMVGVITFASLFWGVYAGTLIDKYNRKHIFLSLTGIDACILGGIALTGILLGGLPTALIIVVYAATIFTYNVHYPNLYAFVQEIFDPTYYSRINSAIEIQGQTTNFLGMMVGGMLIEGVSHDSGWPEVFHFSAWKLEEIFLMDGITYVIGFLLISQIPYVRSVREKENLDSVWSRIFQGFNYLKARPSLFLFGLASYMIFFSLLMVVQIIAPIYVNDHLNEPASMLAFFKGFYAFGAVAAGIIGLSIWIRKRNLITQIIILLIAGGCTYFILGLSQSAMILLICAPILGIANGGTRILRITYLVRVVPNWVIGRVNSFFTVANLICRISFIGVMTLPFFSEDQNGGNIVYATILLGIILFLSAGLLIYYFKTFDPEAARES